MKSEIKIVDDLMAPADAAKVKYKGPKAVAILGMMPDLIKSTMKIPGKDLLETDIRWDVSSPKNDFYGVWMGKREEDGWSKTFVRVIVQGVHDPKDNTGNFYVQLKGTLETKYDYAHFVQRWFWWFFNYGFYYKQRRKYLEAGKDDIHEMKATINERFKINQE